MKALQRKIMRGIYYAYAIRLATLPGVWQGFVMLGALIALTHFVSIGNVLRNLSQVEINQLGVFTYNAVSTTEIWTFFCIGILVFLSLSLRFTFSPRRGSTYSYSHG